ncbi:MAG: transglutaminase domain-containing protein [Coprococcus sp.]
MTDNDVLLSNADVSGIFAGDGAALFDIYNRYVQANYLNVPDGLPSLEAAVQVIQDENGDLSVSQWVAQIQNILWETCTYQKDNLESVPDGSNVIDDFFGRQRKGYCTHFASAGVMMLRMAGIPARYVTGYVIWPDDFKADSASDGYRADVTGYRGHAWVEVYNASQGIWVPVDMTPADSVQTSNYLPTQENSSHSESTDNVSNHYTDSTETISDIGDTGNHTESTEIVSESRNDNDRTEETKTGVNTDISRTNQGISAAVKIVLGMALMIVIAGLGVYVYRRRQNQPRHYSRVNRNKALLAMWAHLTDELDQSGIRTDKEMDDWAYIKWLQSRVQTVKPEELTFLMEKLYQAAFGEDMLSEETYEQCVQICCRIQREIKKK